jgi:hypothetical protein
MASGAQHCVLLGEKFMHFIINWRSEIVYYLEHITNKIHKLFFEIKSSSHCFVIGQQEVDIL